MLLILVINTCRRLGEPPMKAPREHRVGATRRSGPGARATSSKKAAATVTGARRVTMTDVAKVAGVSQSTVSLALNNMTGSRLSGQTRQRVLDAARDVGYQLPGGRVDKGGDTRRRADVPLIAYLVDEISTSPHPVVSIDGAKDAAWREGAALAVFCTRPTGA